MRKLTILVDLDDVMNDLLDTWIMFLNSMYQLRVSKNDIREWDMRKAFPTLSDDEIYLPLRMPWLWKRVTPKEHAVNTVRKLTEDGHRVVVVTASHPSTVGDKLKLFLFHYFPFLTYKDVVITYDKTLIRGDVLIDDAPHNLVGGEYKGIVFTAPHNIDFDAEGAGFLRANNWDDVYTIICNMANCGTGELDDCN